MWRQVWNGNSVFSKQTKSNRGNACQGLNVNRRDTMDSWAWFNGKHPFSLGFIVEINPSCYLPFISGHRRKIQKFNVFTLCFSYCILMVERPHCKSSWMKMSSKSDSYFCVIWQKNLLSHIFVVHPQQLSYHPFLCKNLRKLKKF